MTTRKHIHEETFDVTPEVIFDLLVTPSTIRQWWGASHVIIDRQQGGLWVGLWGDEDSPEYITAWSAECVRAAKADCVFGLGILFEQRAFAF